VSCNLYMRYIPGDQGSGWKRKKEVYWITFIISTNQL
jgi:hypothetical protein